MAVSELATNTLQHTTGGGLVRILAEPGRVCCEVVDRGVTYQIDRITPLTTEEGLRAFGNPEALVLRALRRTEFRYLAISCAPSDRPGTMRS